MRARLANVCILVDAVGALWAFDLGAHTDWDSPTPRVQVEPSSEGKFLIASAAGCPPSASKADIHMQGFEIAFMHSFEMTLHPKDLGRICCIQPARASAERTLQRLCRLKADRLSGVIGNAACLVSSRLESPMEPQKCPKKLARKRGRERLTCFRRWQPENNC